jgi:hypothetical protein
MAEPLDLNELEAFRDLSSQERAIARHSESLWRQAHQIAEDNSGVDPGDVYHALRCLEIEPAERLRRGLSRGRLRAHAREGRMIASFPMRGRTFWRTVTVDRSNMLERFFELLEAEHVRFCLIGGQALNAYVDPVVSLDLDVVIASNQLAAVESLLRGQFGVEPFPHSLNVSERDSDLRVQIQLDPRYSVFLERSTVREVLGLRLPVAAIEDLLQGKVWAVQDVTRRGSKRQKDLADIARILEWHGHLRSAVPADVLARLI